MFYTKVPQSRRFPVKPSEPFLNETRSLNQTHLEGLGGRQEIKR